jgi:hypothetical protein
MKKLPLFVGALALFAVAGINLAMAANGNFSTVGVAPVIYQTNWWHGPTVIHALSGTPSTAKISSVSLDWGYSRPPYNPNNPTYTIEAKICTSSLCKYTTSFTDSLDPYWNGKPATADWQFSFNAISSTTKVFVTHLTQAHNIDLTVMYSY